MLVGLRAWGRQRANGEVDMAHIHCDRNPWTDIDSGNDLIAYDKPAWVLLSQALKMDQVAVLSILGLEVDKTSAAEEQTESWWTLFWEYLRVFGGLVVGAGALAGGLDGLLKAGIAITTLLYVGIVVLVVVIIIGIFVASWAAADVIGVDTVIPLTPTTLWSMTEPGVPVIAEHAYGQPVGQTVTVIPNWKHTESPLDDHALYVEERQYNSDDDHEGSTYGIHFDYRRKGLAPA